MKRLPSEANSGRATDPAEAGLGETREPMDKNRIEPEPKAETASPPGLPEGRAKPGNADTARRAGTTRRSRLVYPWK